MTSIENIGALTTWLTYLKEDFMGIWDTSGVHATVLMPHSSSKRAERLEKTMAAVARRVRETPQDSVVRMFDCVCSGSSPMSD